MPADADVFNKFHFLPPYPDAPVSAQQSEGSEGLLFSEFLAKKPPVFPGDGGDVAYPAQLINGQQHLRIQFAEFLGRLPQKLVDQRQQPKDGSYRLQGGNGGGAQQKLKDGALKLELRELKEVVPLYGSSLHPPIRIQGHIYRPPFIWILRMILQFGQAKQQFLLCFLKTGARKGLEVVGNDGFRGHGVFLGSKIGVFGEWGCGFLYQ